MKMNSGMSNARKKYFDYLEGAGKMPKRSSASPYGTQEEALHYAPDHEVHHIDMDDDDYRSGPEVSDGYGSMDARGRSQEEFREAQKYMTVDEITGDPYVEDTSGEPHTAGMLRNKHDMRHMKNPPKRGENVDQQTSLGDRRELSKKSFASALRNRRYR